MALTDQEEAAVRAILGAVAGAGVTPDELAATLRVGKLTTQISAIDAQVANQQAEADAQQQKSQATIVEIRAKQDDLRQQLRKLQGA